MIKCPICGTEVPWKKFSETRPNHRPERLDWTTTGRCPKCSFEMRFPYMNRDKLILIIDGEPENGSP